MHTATLKTLIASCSLLKLSVSVIQLLDPPLSAGTKLSPPNTWHNCGCRNSSKCQCTLSLKHITVPKHLNINTLSLFPAAFPGHHPLRPTESVVSCTLTWVFTFRYNPCLNLCMQALGLQLDTWLHWVYPGADYSMWAHH